MLYPAPVRPLVAIVGLVLALAACAPAFSPTAPAAVSPAVGPAATAAAPTTPPTTPAAATAPAAVPAGGTRLTIVADSSEARYRAREQLAGRNLPSEAVGSTKAVTGTILLGPNGEIVRGGSKITIDLRTLKSDESRRDGFIQRSTLQTATYPEADFVPAEARGLPNPLPTSGEATFDLAGDLTVHGTTRPTVWKVTARFSPAEIAGTATTTVKLEDFGMTSPRVGPVLSIEETLGLEIDFRAARSSAAALLPSP